MLITPLLRRTALVSGLVDVSDGNRKLHEHPVAPVGGLAIAFAVIVAGIAYSAAAHSSLHVPDTPLLWIAVGALAMHVLGLIDDVRPMTARVKLLGQLLIAIGVCRLGLRVDHVVLPFLGHIVMPPLVAELVTIGWLVAITNAFNLIDGVDGLAPGVALVALVMLSLIALINGNTAIAIVACAFAGATAGVLAYNVAPASVFLGDSGSLMLGFVLASTALIATGDGEGSVNLAVPVLVLGVPVLDTTVAVARRFLRGQPIFLPDRGHIHHRLLNLGYSARGTALRLAALSVVLGVGGLVLVLRPEFSTTVYIVLLLAGAVFVQHLRYDEFEELAGTVIRGAAQRQQIQRSVRLREAAAHVAEARTLDLFFAAMRQALDDGEIERAELSLRRSFAMHGAGASLTLEGDEERMIWTCGDTDPSIEACELSFPLLTRSGARFGSLTVWQHPNLRERSVAQWRAIDCFLRPAAQQRLEALWRPIPQPIHIETRVKEPHSRRVRRDTPLLTPTYPTELEHPSTMIGPPPA